MIPSSLVQGRDHALKNFAISRFFRLFPAYWLAVILGYFGTYYLWSKPFSLSDWLANAVMLSEWLGAQPAMGLFWTLQIELVFYVFCASLFALNLLHREKTKGLLALVFSLIFLLSLGKSIPLLFKLPDIILSSQYWAAWLSMMFFGAAFRQNRDKFGRANQLFVRLYLVGWLLFLPLAGVISWIKMGHFLHPDLVRFYSSHSLGILVFYLGSTIFQLKSHKLAVLGRMSYSIYLFHGAIIFSLAWLMVHAIGVQNKIDIHLAFSMTIVFIITVAFSNFVYKFIELPSINIGKSFK